VEEVSGAAAAADGNPCSVWGKRNATDGGWGDAAVQAVQVDRVAAACTASHAAAACRWRHDAKQIDAVPCN
jgi:hypothetical protein